MSGYLPHAFDEGVNAGSVLQLYIQPNGAPLVDMFKIVPLWVWSLVMMQTGLGIAYR